MKLWFIYKQIYLELLVRKVKVRKVVSNSLNNNTPDHNPFLSKYAVTILTKYYIGDLKKLIKLK